jgi:hypothetical protein
LTGILDLRIRRVTVVAAVVAVVAAFGAAPSAGSGPPNPATIQGVRLTETTTFVKSAGGNTFLDFSSTGTYSGTFTGTYVEEIDVVVHPNGLSNFHGTVTFTGTVAGCGSGTIIFAIVGRADFNVVPTPVTATAATLVGKGTLPVHATIDFTVILAPPITFTGTGRYHC